MKRKLMYLIAVYEEEDGTYTVYFPDFPEMAADSGKSFEDAIDQSKKFLNEVIELKVERNQELPVPSRGQEFKAKLDPDNGEPFCVVPLTVYPPARTERINITTKGDLIARIDDYAKEHHITRSELMVKSTLDYIRTNP